MKTLIVECTFTIEVPWHEKWGDDAAARFRIEENSCPGTGPVDGALSELLEVSEKNSICWACTVGGENKLIAIEDREPRNYVDEIEFKEEVLPKKKCHCGAVLIRTQKKNASITMTDSRCPECGMHSHSMEM
jgi:hypothetical protein